MVPGRQTSYHSPGRRLSDTCNKVWLVLLTPDRAPPHAVGTAGYVTPLSCIQVVPKLMVPSIACNNKKTKSDWFMFSLLMNSSHFSTQALKRSGISHIALSGISAEKQHQADREFAMRAAFDVADPSCQSCSGRSPKGFRWATGLGCCQIIYPSPKSQEKLSWHHRLVLAAV